MNDNWFRERSLFSRPSAKPPKPKKKWRIRYVIFNAFKRTCMLIGFFVIFGAIMGAILSGTIIKEYSPPLPEKIILYMKLTDPVIEHRNQTGPYNLTSRPYTISEIIDALDRGARDPQVHGFVLSLKGGVMTPSQIQELRAALVRFKGSGKFTHIYAPSYAEQGLGISTYYLASAFETVWMQPLGMVSVSGINAEMPFFRDALEEIGIEPQFFQRKDYKSVFESVTRNSMSPENRAMMTDLIGDIALQMKLGIMQGRGLEDSAFDQAIARGYLTDTEAKEAGLIDRLAYIDELNNEIKTTVGLKKGDDDKIFVLLHHYNRSKARDKRLEALENDKPRVALIYAVGAITHNSSQTPSLSSAGQIANEIRKAVDDDETDAIVLRIDSPGGSPTAAESIRRALVLAREKGKPVVVSMGSSAASGGYWIAAPADAIFATASTFTGSIGVAGGKVSLAQLWPKIHVNWDSVKWGENADMWSFNKPYSEAQTERMNMVMDSIYDGFIRVVAEGRGMPEEAVERVAKGRVWTGRQALEHGLIDEIGGLDAALDHTAGMLGKTGRLDIAVELRPRPKTPVEQLFSILENQVYMGRLMGVFAPAIESAAPFFGHAEAVRNSEPVTVYRPLPDLR